MITIHNAIDTFGNPGQDYVTPNMATIKASTLGRQRLWIDGDRIGFQFNKASNGVRTADRDVTGAHVGEDGQVYGYARAFGLHLLVRFSAGRSWDAISMVAQ